MTPEHVDAFAHAAEQITKDVEAIVAHGETVRNLADDARATLRKLNRATAKLRTTDNRHMIGPLNSVSAAKAQHTSLDGGLVALETALASFEDMARDLRLLHPDVLKALRDKLSASLAGAVDE